MKNTIKMLIVAIIFALSLVSCCKDEPTPEPPKPQPPAMALSVSEISLMLGMSGEVGLSNVADIRVEGNQDIAVLNYDSVSKKLKIETKAVGVTTLKIIDKADKNRSIELKVKVTPVVFGMIGQDAQVILEANYRYQSPKSLHMASSGAERRNQFIKIPLQAEWKQGATVSITKKDTNAPEQQIPTTISQFRDSSGKEKVVYLKTNDGKFIIFPVYKK
ncbi:MAG: hypothetical protein Q4B28_03710 [bacterium]|nr:hypothetical protein [bacterium]